MKRIGLAVGAVVLAWVVSGLLMHLGMKRHALLDFDPEIPDAQPGERMAASIIAVMDHELDSVTGWRPNDFFLWGPALFADNNANRQLGIIVAIRETTRVFKDHLTKVSSDQYDANLVQADTMFRNDAEKFWFPSAESRFRSGVEFLRAYITGLHENPPRSKLLNRRNVELHPPLPDVERHARRCAFVALPRRRRLPAHRRRLLPRAGSGPRDVLRAARGARRVPGRSSEPADPGYADRGVRAPRSTRPRR